MSTAAPQVTVPNVASPLDDDETPNFSAMTGKKLDEFCVEHEIEIDGWPDLSVANKKTELAKLFGQSQAEAQGALDPNNTIHKAVTEIQKLDSEQQAVEAIAKLQDSTDEGQFRIGGILTRMQAQGWQSDAEDFYTFIEGTFGFKTRKAQYLMSIYDTLVNLDVPWQMASKLGWTKLRLLAPILDADNLAEVLAATLPLTTAEVGAFVKQFKAGGGEIPQGGSTPISRMTFVVHEDQRENIKLAVEKAREEGNTQFDGMALEYICLDYLNSGAKPQAKNQSVAEVMAGIKAQSTLDGNVEEAMLNILKQFCELYPEINLDIEGADTEPETPDPEED